MSQEVTTSEAKRLAVFVTKRREALGLTLAQMDERLHGEGWKMEAIEQAQLQSVGEPEFLCGLAFALNLSPADLYEKIGRDWRLLRTL